jgi:hypothetical protein
VARVPVPSDDYEIEETSRRPEGNSFTLICRIDVIPKQRQGDEEYPGRAEGDYGFSELHNFVTGVQEDNHGNRHDYSER